MVLFADFDPLVGILAASERKQLHFMEVFHGGDLLSPPQQTFPLQVGQLAALNRLNSSACCWQTAAAIISEDD